MFYKYEVVGKYITVPEGCELRLSTDQFRRRQHCLSVNEGQENCFQVLKQTGFKCGEIFEINIILENQSVIPISDFVEEDEEKTEILLEEKIETDSDFGLPQIKEKRGRGRPRKSFLTPKKREK